MLTRLKRFEEKLDQVGIDGFLVTGQNNIYYMTGFWGTSATVFISKTRCLFVTDARYTLIAKQFVQGFDIIESRDPLQEITKVIQADKLERIGFDSQVSFAYYQNLQAVFAGYHLQAQTNFMEALRMIKDASEMATIRKACSISDRAFTDVLDFIKAGQTTELQVANFLDFRMREYGASGISFETIVASGKRSAMPHGVASDKVIESGDMLTLDFGCYYNHYVSDMTRTIHIGDISDKEREVYQLVLEANQAVIDSVKAGMVRKDYDKAARNVITNAGYGDYFTHGIGHGIGLDIHEIPYFGRSEEVVEAGMVITDEPGIYLDNAFGVRIEDDLIITEEGCEVLTLAPKELIVLP